MNWQLAILPGGHPPSIVAASSLYDRVRDGNGWFAAAWSPEILFTLKILNVFCTFKVAQCNKLNVTINSIIT